MVRNKYVITPLMFFAWAVIFAHSIIPHHHHSEDLFTECNHCHMHESAFDDNSQIWDHDSDCKGHACKFEIEAFTQVSIDNIFIVNTDNTFLNSVSINKTANTDYYLDFISEPIPKTNFLRGPPAILFS